MGTERSSKLENPETRQVPDRLVLTLEHLQVGQHQVFGGSSSVGMPHPLQMFYGKLAQLSQIR